MEHLMTILLAGLGLRHTASTGQSPVQLDRQAIRPPHKARCTGLEADGQRIARPSSSNVRAGCGHQRLRWHAAGRKYAVPAVVAPCFGVCLPRGESSITRRPGSWKAGPPTGSACPASVVRPAREVTAVLLNGYVLKLTGTA